MIIFDVCCCPFFLVERTNNIAGPPAAGTERAAGNMCGPRGAKAVSRPDPEGTAQRGPDAAKHGWFCERIGRVVTCILVCVFACAAVDSIDVSCEILRRSDIGQQRERIACVKAAKRRRMEGSLDACRRSRKIPGRSAAHGAANSR